MTLAANSAKRCRRKGAISADTRKVSAKIGAMRIRRTENAAQAASGDGSRADRPTMKITAAARPVTPIVTAMVALTVQKRRYGLKKVQRGAGRYQRKHAEDADEQQRVSECIHAARRIRHGRVDKGVPEGNDGHRDKDGDHVSAGNDAELCESVHRV